MTLSEDQLISALEYLLSNGRITSFSTVGRSYQYDLPPSSSPLSEKELVDAWDAYVDTLPTKIWQTSFEFIQEFKTDPDGLTLLDVLTSESTRLWGTNDPDVMSVRASLLAWPGEVWNNDDKIQQGMLLLVYKGVITDARRKNILGIE